MPFPRIVKQAEVRREELLDAGRELFLTRGYDATSVNDIIARVGVSKGAFYHHFASKEELLEGLAARYAERLVAAAQGILEDPTLNAFTRLTGYMARLRQDKLAAAHELTIIFEPALRDDNARLQRMIQRTGIKTMLPILTRIIAEGVAEKSFDTADPESAAEAILHLLGQTSEMVSAMHAAGSLRDRETAATQMLRKLTYLGTVIDRILGLPEGSVEIVDETAMRALTRALAEAESAA